jgi:hypothetical protein
VTITTSKSPRRIIDLRKMRRAALRWRWDVLWRTHWAAVSAKSANRKGMLSERGKKELALLSDRAGDIVGERLEFIHRVHRRDTFSCGALCAAG